MSILKEQARLLHIAWLRLRGKRCQPLNLHSQRIVIVAPHPDDEVIGCGGLIARLTSLGYPPQVIILSSGGGSHRGCCNIDEETVIEQRRELTIKAAHILGLPHEYIHHLDFKDGEINGTDKNNLQSFHELLKELHPAIVFVPHHGEGWPDHVNVRTMIEEIKCKAEIYEYCVWMWYYNVWRLDWRNARVLHLSTDEHRRKTEAVDAYTTPAAPCEKPWSGVLPKVFLKAAKWNRELYFRVR